MISIQTLQFFPLLNHLDHQRLNIAARFCNEVHKLTNEWLFEEGEEAEYLYLLKEGSVSLTLSIPQREGGENVQRSSSLDKGAMLGWSAIIEPHIYKFGAVANKPTTLIQIDGYQMKQFIVDYPDSGIYILYKISQVIAERLEFSCIQLLSINESILS